MKWIVLLLLPLAGCLGGGADDASEGAPAAPTMAMWEPNATAVVAVIDTGVNVYHSHFFKNHTFSDDLLATFAIDGQLPQRITLTRNGTYQENVAADAEIWNNMSRETLYYFEGTNILGVSFTSAIAILDDGGDSHGTGTAASVFDANPEAIVIMVEGMSNGKAENWAATMPFVDFLSESYGPLGSIPFGPVVGSTTSDNNRIAWNNGKVVFGASDNTPALSPGDSTSGPWYVVAIAGDHPDTQCREEMSGNVPDFTADWTQTLPNAYDMDGYRTISGTSFATPTSAGVASAILQEVRNATGSARNGTSMAVIDGNDLQQWELRDAINRTASYFSMDCSGGVPVTPATAAQQQGWGHIGPELIGNAVAHLLGEENFSRPPDVEAYMQAQYEARKQAWG